MANTDLIVPLVVAAIGLVGTMISLLWGWHVQKRTREYEMETGKDLQEHQDTLEELKKQHERAMAQYNREWDEKLEAVKVQVEQKRVAENLTEKYSQPLLVAAHDLQQRLFELVEYPISRQHVSTKEGLDDLKIFSCYLLAQYLVYAYILRTKTNYLSFTHDEKLKNIRNMMYMIDEELDQRRDDIGDGAKVGVWPGARIVVCERMIVPGSRRDVNELLDGGFGLEVKGFDQFHSEWTENFQEPMGFFCKWIDDMLEGRLRRKAHWDAALRCLQHLLVDLIILLDLREAYIQDPERRPKCNSSSRGCDCADCPNRAGDLNSTLKERQETRYVENGLWNVNGLKPSRTKKLHGTTAAYVDAAGKEFDLKLVKDMTRYVRLD